MRSMWIWLLPMLWVPAISLAQLDTGTIVGAVADSTGLMVPNAKVVVQNLETGARVDVTADSSGNFIAPCA